MMVPKLPAIFIFLTLSLGIIYIRLNMDVFQMQIDNPLKRMRNKYLINTPNCRIPDEDPFNDDVKPFLHSYSYAPCSSKKLLSHIETDGSDSVLVVNRSLFSSYSFFRISCCATVITRRPELNQCDIDIIFSKCEYFENRYIVKDEVIGISCSNFMRFVYVNVHFVLDRKKLEVPKEYSTTSPGVVFFGIDSVSRLNFIRTLPKTHGYLRDHGFVSLKGYTKIDDNTFPNLVAVLTGQTTDQIYAECRPNKVHLDNCSFIWHEFKKLGYLTGYAEDETSLNTFNYNNRLGFHKPPADLYGRPYFLAAEKFLPTKVYASAHFCSGPETNGERVMNLAKTFLKIKQIPKFGLFWTTSFSHDDLNLPSSMDEKIEQFLEDIYDDLDNTIFIIFSDHGFRFGDIRYTHTGWLEERQPFIYFHFPVRFKEAYPSFYSNFLENTKKLTSPFDLYMTLQDIVTIGDKTYKPKPSQACPKCISLLREVDVNRTCEDAAIVQHWCLCNTYRYMNTEIKTVRDIGEFIVKKVNEINKSYKEGYKCARFTANRILSAGILSDKLDDTMDFIKVVVETLPPAAFEATVERRRTNYYDDYDFKLKGDISRINRYSGNVRCLKHNPILEKYCYCDGLFTAIKSAICKLVMHICM